MIFRERIQLLQSGFELMIVRVGAYIEENVFHVE
jgi:hypothetical protein